MSSYEIEAVLDDIRDERVRQISVEGWTPEHDDTHSAGEMAQAAACYAKPHVGLRAEALPVPSSWPWHAKWWKPKDRRHNLVRAAALIVAEIERLDRNQKPTIAAIAAAEKR